MAEFHFIRPLWLLALLPAAWLLVALCKRRASASGWDGVIAPALLQSLMLGRSQRLGASPVLLLGAAWLLAVVALAGPTWERAPQPVYRASVDRVVVLDMSPSMAQTDVAPDRLTRARFAINDLMAQTREGRTALIVFGAEPHVVTPLTDDSATVAQLLEALTLDVIPAPGDRAAAAIRASMPLLAAAKSRSAHVILFSDGIGDPADSISAAVQLRRSASTLSVVGIGSAHESQLRELARSGGGVYRTLESLAAQPVFDFEAVTDFAHDPHRDASVDLWIEKGVWLLLPLLAMAAVGYRRGWLAVLLLVLFQPPREAMAANWADLWLRRDQQAKHLLDEGQAQRAAELFEDPDWRAAALYQDGKFDEAAALLQDSTAVYNRANALAKAGKLREALQHYDDALRRQPDDEDARFNRELVKKLLDQQQQQQQQGQEQGQNQDGQQQSQQQGQEQDQQQEGEQRQGEAQQGDELQDQAQDQQQQGQGQDQAQAEQQDRSSPSSSPSPQAGEDARQAARNDVARQVQRGAAGERDPSRESAPQQRDEGPPSEQALALRQWLRQVPDDPGGLLRRKFMLEHLQRQKERDSR